MFFLSFSTYLANDNVQFFFVLTPLRYHVSIVNILFLSFSNQHLLIDKT